MKGGGRNSLPGGGRGGGGGEGGGLLGCDHRSVSSSLQQQGYSPCGFTALVTLPDAVDKSCSVRRHCLVGSDER